MHDLAGKFSIYHLVDRQKFFIFLKKLIDIYYYLCYNIDIKIKKRGKNMTVKELKNLILAGVETEVVILNDNNPNFLKKYENIVDFEHDETIDSLNISQERFRSVILYENGLTIYVD